MAPTTESRLNVEALSKRDVLLLFSVLEGELEARDFVIQALKAQRRDCDMWERYGKYNLSDPFLALQRDSEVLQSSGQTRGDGGSSSQRREGFCGATARSDPLAVLKLVVGHCRRMQEKMLKQLAAAENRHRRVIADLEEEKRKHAEDTAEGDDVTYILEKERERLLQQLEFEKAKTSRMERENKRLYDQLEDQRVQHKQLVMAVSRECNRSGTRAHEESQRANEFSHRLDRERAANQALRAELEEEKKRAMQTEARREELLAEFDTEREQLGLRLRKEEARCRALQEELEKLKREMNNAEEKSNKMQTKMNVLMEEDGNVEKQGMLTNGSSQTNPQAHSPTNSNQSPDMPSTQAAYQAGINQRFHAARHKFQGPFDQDSQTVSSPPNSPCDFSPCAAHVTPPDSASSKQAAHSTVTQALSRFSTQQSPSKPTSPNSSPFGTDYRTLAHSGMLSPTIRSPTIPRGNPPPIPPKKPGLADTPSSPATLRAAHLAQMTAGCGCSSNSENSKEPDLVLSSSG
ncbi:CTTNBP2 N-terminal-like protein [Sinocyclocheilus anshuiensis]|uniref:CTTNBP2 N-terminal-like protein n=1 Tax=Sinocyclocheilus anshuiensis TaxID=1608454 RepID=UPI0007BA0BD7|nr:PREDICTED: CTTNBP2 N-terminal-like protein [Sinocyclocheilus anshuiensis]